MTDTWQRLLRPMLRARRFDETLLGYAALIPDAFHVSIGLEAGAAALALARRPEDYVMLSHRNHGQLVAMGANLENLYREIFGRDGSPQRGRAGSFHLAAPELGVPYTSAMVAGGVPLGVGLALGAIRQGRAAVAFACFGDAALGEGVLSESLYLASLWKLPVVFVCDNNLGRAAAAASWDPRRSLLDLPAGDGVPGRSVEATTPRRVAEEIGGAADEARGGGGPRFVEICSEPWPGNVDARRPVLVDGPLDLKRVIAEKRGFDAVDPVAEELRTLHDEGISMELLAELDEELRLEAETACERAVAAPEAPLDTVLDDVMVRS